MIVSLSVKPVKSILKSNITNYYVCNGKVIERVEAQDKLAFVLRGSTNCVLRRYTTNFVIKHAIYVTFDTDISEDYLCLIGESCIDFYSMKDEMFCGLPLPFKIKAAHKSKYGLLLERKLPNSVNSHSESATLFSISHPYCEVLPVLCKFKDEDDHCHYAWSKRNISIVSVTDCPSGDLFLCYDHTRKLNCIYFLRKCSKIEKAYARTDLANHVFCFDTPKSLESLNNSPGFMLKNRLPEKNEYAVNSPNFLLDNKVTPVRRTIRTRSMLAAAAALEEHLPYPISPAISLKSHRSNLSKTSYRDSPMLRFRNTSFGSTPRRVQFESFLELDDKNSLELSVDLFMECLWSETGIDIEKTNDKRLASQFLIASDFHGQKFAYFFIPSENIVKILRVNSLNDGFSVFGVPTNVRARSLARVLGTHFVLLLEENDNTIAIYTGPFLLGHICLTNPQEPSTSSANQEITEILTAYTNSFIVVHDSGSRLLHEINQGFCSPTVEKLLRSIMEALNKDKGLQFFATWFRGNHWRVLNMADSHSEKVELTLLLEHFFTCFGVDTSEMLFLDHVRYLRKMCSRESEPTECKRSRSLDDGERFWNYLGEEETAKCTSFLDFVKKKRKIKISSTNHEDWLQTHVFSVFAAFHSFYESLKLDRRDGHLMEFVIEPLFVFASLFGLDEYVKFYKSDFLLLENYEIVISEELKERLSGIVVTNTRHFHTERVPSMIDFINQIVINSGAHLPYLPQSPHYPTRTIACFAVALGKIISASNLYKLFGKNWQKRLNLNETKKILSIIGKEKYSPLRKAKLCLDLFKITNRDLCYLNDTMSEVFTKVKQEALNKQANTALIASLRIFPTIAEQKKWQLLRWSTDIRVDNIAQMLDSSRPVLIPIKKMPNFNDTQLREQQENFLNVTALKTITRPFGQALLTFRTVNPGPYDSLQVPNICLHGRTNPNNIQIDYPQADANKQMIEWANFYNGLARALSLIERDAAVLDWEWLSMSLKAQKSPGTAAGCLFAFGLTGHIKEVNVYNIHELLTKGDRFLTIALLMGCAIAQRGTSDIQVYKMLATHLPFLLGPTLLEFRIEPIIQTAALVAIGYLFSETAHASLTHQLINEMTRETFFEADSSAERYSYVLATGFAIGLINLGRGSEITANEIPLQGGHFDIQSRLCIILRGGPRSRCRLVQDESSCMFTDSAYSVTRGRNSTEPVIAASATTASAAASSTSSPVSSHVKERADVNIHLTSHAACVALGLMFLKTNDKWITRALTIPNTFVDIEKIRPDMLMCRTMCRLLVQYDQIGKSNEWMENQIPEIVRKYARLLLQNDENCWWDDYIDMTTIAQAFLYTTAGCILAMGLKYASTWDDKVKDIMISFYDKLFPERPSLNPYQKLCSIAGKNTVHTCLNACISAMALLMAGSGDIQIIQICRKVRNFKLRHSPLVKENSIHSAHVIANMALGMLVIGNARYSFSQSNISIASLVIAFYPIYPHSITDNRLYFQPLRFVWPLAVESRFFTTVDAKTGENISVEVEVNLNDETTYVPILKTPCILPHLNKILALHLKNTDYGPVSLMMSNRMDVRKLHEVVKNFYGRMPIHRATKRLEYDLRYENPVFLQSDKFNQETMSEHSYDFEIDELRKLAIENADDEVQIEMEVDENLNSNVQKSS